MQQVYELNLPAFSDIIRTDFLGFKQSEDRYDYITTDIPCAKILKKEYLNLLGFNWNEYRYFRKSNFKGSIHTDLGYKAFLKNECAWGINWIFNGSGTIEFWNFESVVETGRTLGAQNYPEKGVVPKYEAKKEPDYVYENLENKVYLVNASLPHRAIGGPNRCCFSLRAIGDGNENLNWTQIVERFASLIKS